MKTYDLIETSDFADQPETDASAFLRKEVVRDELRIVQAKLAKYKAQGMIVSLCPYERDNYTYTVPLNLRIRDSREYKFSSRLGVETKRRIKHLFQQVKQLRKLMETVEFEDEPGRDHFLRQMSAEDEHDILWAKIRKLEKQGAIEYHATVFKKTPKEDKIPNYTWVLVTKDPNLRKYIQDTFAQSYDNWKILNNK